MYVFLAYGGHRSQFTIYIVRGVGALIKLPQSTILCLQPVPSEEAHERTSGKLGGAIDARVDETSV